MGKRNYDVNVDGKDDVAMQVLCEEGQKPDSSQTDGPYDPHEHRNRPAPTTNTETLIHLLKGSLGTGILAMPNAFYNSGSIVGIVSTIVIGIICTYCLHILVQAQYRLCKKHRVPMMTYPVSMKRALEMGPAMFVPTARFAPAIVDGFLIVYQLGICCVYIVFVATNIKSVVDIHYTKFDIRLYMCMLLLPLILINYIRNLKKLAPFSTLANVITFVGLGMVLYYLFDDLPSFSERDYVGELRNYPLFFGTTLFALEAVGVIIALENNMKTPKNFGERFGVLNVGMTVIVILYVLVGVVGFVKYGPASEASVTLNLPAGEALSQSVQILFAIAIFISYALQSYVPVEIIWDTYLKERYAKSSHSLLFEYILRTVLVLITFLLAVAIPNLGLFISLFGALCLSALGIAFPAIMEMCTLWPDQLGTLYYILIKDILLIVFGLIGLVVGTYCALSDIIATL